MATIATHKKYAREDLGQAVTHCLLVLLIIVKIATSSKSDFNLMATMTTAVVSSAVVTTAVEAIAELPRDIKLETSLKTERK